MDNNDSIRDAILRTIQTQLEENNPPETRMTFLRLMDQGYSKEDAIGLVGYVVAAEIFGIIKEQREFDADRYVEALKALPDLPENAFATEEEGSSSSKVERTQ